MPVTQDRDTRIHRSAQPQAGQPASDVSYYASRSLSGGPEVSRAAQPEQAEVQNQPMPEQDGAEQEQKGHDISRMPITTDARDESGMKAGPQAAPDEKDGAAPAPEDAKPQNEQSVAATTEETQAVDKQEDQTVARAAAPEAAAEAEPEEEELQASVAPTAAPEGAESESETA